MHSYNKKKIGSKIQKAVLILVLMEDALVLCEELECTADFLCLNPCFNGRCTRTSSLTAAAIGVGCLNPCFNGRCTRTNSFVGRCICGDSLNPCFNGRCTRTGFGMSM